MNGPTIVPCLVMHASTAAALLSIRFMTLSCSPMMSPAYLSKSTFDLMKNVVLPESPYGVCTTRSEPRPLATDSFRNPVHECAVPSTLGTDGAPASLPSWVVTIFESRRRRKESDGMIRL